MLKNPAEDEGDISSTKLKDISVQVSPLLRYWVCLLVLARELWWINQE
jgi:hypothetical protein